VSLQIGQVVRYGNGLWRVDYVNECRARIVPLGKRHVVILDDDGQEVKAFDAERKGVNISPNSGLDVVTDVERVKDELELEAAEAELRAARLAARLAARREVVRATAGATLGTGRAVKGRRASSTQGVRSDGGWGIGPTTSPALTQGSQGVQVHAYVQGHPGLHTSALSAALPGVKNLHQCLSRLKLTGYLVRVSIR
jgi:hypothetical protein